MGFFFVTGVNHRTLSIEEREKFAVSPGNALALLKKICSCKGVKEAVLLSTCNRTEVHFFAENIEAVNHIQLLFKADAGWYCHEGEKAVRHLFRLCAGLDSMALGESQVFGQVKEAYELASCEGTTGPFLNQLFHRAFFVAKRVRSETGIGIGAVSMSSLAIEMIESSVCFRSPPKLLVIGAGDVARKAAKTYAERRLGPITIINRTEEKAALLAGELNGARSAPWEDLETELSQTHGVIVCVSSSTPILTASLTERAIARSERGTLTILDMGLPRDVTSETAEISGVTLYNLDDLEEVAAKNRAHRTEEAQSAEEIALREAKIATEDLFNNTLEPTLSHLMRKCEEIRKQEMARTFRRLELSKEHKKQLEACTVSIVSKILHDPIINLKQAAREGRNEFVSALQQAFNLASKDE